MLRFFQTSSPRIVALAQTQYILHFNAHHVNLFITAINNPLVHEPMSCRQYYVTVKEATFLV